MALSFKCVAKIDLGDGTSRIGLKAVVPDASAKGGRQQEDGLRAVGSVSFVVDNADAAQFVEGTRYSVQGV